MAENSNANHQNLLKTILRGFIPSHRHAIEVDYKAFQSPFAEQTDWFHLQPNGPTTSIYDLHVLDSKLMVFVPSWRAKIFGVLAIVFGIFLIICALPNSNNLTFSNWMTALSLSGVFCVIGGLILHPLRTQVVLDFAHSLVEERQIAGLLGHLTRVVRSHSLDDAIALQILPEQVPVNDQPEFSYELNLIIKDGTRLHLIGSGDIAVLRTQAEQIAAQMDVPVWDGSLHMIRG